MSAIRNIAMLTGLILSLAPPCWCQGTSVGKSEYYKGVGEDADLEKARSSALQRLVEQIQVFVSSSSNRSVVEKNEGLQDTYSARSITRSSLKLQDLQESVLPLPDDSLSRNQVHFERIGPESV